MKDFNGCSNLNHSTCVGLLQLLFFDSLVDVLSHKPSRARVCACVRVCVCACVQTLLFSRRGLGVQSSAVRCRSCLLEKTYVKQTRTNSTNPGC